MTSDETGMVAIFQSTLPREERRCMRVRIAAPLCNFNPRSHERSDIHIKFIAVMFLNFNPRSHERSDVRYSVFIGPSVISIHAPTRGATSKAVGCASTKSNFNPRSHERSDKSPVGAMFVGNNISIHAPTRGATVTADNITFCDLYFNPRSHERSDRSVSSPLVFCNYFNPRSHERSDVR